MGEEIFIEAKVDTLLTS